ncbi:CBM_collapsed_G0043140.mRNA.1.CDS.1 [Saccharomyces cerevisiae]|nr:CBM_collapsed_G0043140.mRNA.1.CDS.1 [Saccharomyces cerevisiae]
MTYVFGITFNEYTEYVFRTPLHVHLYARFIQHVIQLAELIEVWFYEKILQRTVHEIWQFESVNPPALLRICF